MRNIYKVFIVFAAFVTASINLSAQSSGPYIRVGAGYYADVNIRAGYLFPCRLSIGAEATTWSMFCGIGGDTDTRFRLGDFLTTRATAFYKRVQRLVMYDLYDFYKSIIGRMASLKAKVLDWMTNHPVGPLWKIASNELDGFHITKWVMHQGYAIFEDINTNCEFFNCIKKHNIKEFSKLINQDTLTLADTSDIYAFYYKAQLYVLTNANDITSKLFTVEESADHHRYLRLNRFNSNMSKTEKHSFIYKLWNLDLSRLMTHQLY